MKKRLWLWLALLLPLASRAQTPEQNMMKYWKHRQQLERFICTDALKLGPAAVSTTRGSFLVAAVRENHINGLTNPEYGINGESDSDNCNTIGTPNLNNLPELDTSHHMITSTGFPALGIAGFTGAECAGIRYGADQTIEMGYYIGVLATEWRLLTNSGQDATATAEELWGALEAYERLDRNAELIYDPYPTTGVFDGYFLRDDLLNPHYPSQDDDLDGNPNFPGVGSATSSYNSQPGKGRAYFTPSYQYRAFSECYVNVPSPDQVLALLMGMALVTKSVDPGVIVFGEDLRGKAQYTAHLLVKYARDNGWNYRNPEGDNYPNRTGVSFISYHLAKAANIITGNSQTTDFNMDGNVPDALNDYQNAESAANGVAWTTLYIPAWYTTPSQPPTEVTFFNEELPIWTPNNSVSLSQSLTAFALSNYDLGLLDVLAEEHSLGMFALLRDYLHDENSTSTAVMDEMEELLNIAPCDKFCTCPEGENVFPGDGPCNPAYQQLCNPVPEWMSINRWTHISNRLGNGYKQDYTGLDYMLLHNLYLLRNAGTVSQFANTYDGMRDLDLIAPQSFMGGVYYESFNLPGYYTTNQDISSVAQITSPFPAGDPRNGNVTYRAGNSIRLLPGFRAEGDTYFRAYIDDFECGVDNYFHKMATPPSIEQAQGTSVPLLSQDATLSVYPNPSLGEFQITGAFPEATSVSWSLYSMMGSRLMGSEGEAAVTEYADEIDLASYPASTYILVVQTGAEQHRFRLVKQ